MQLHDVPSPRLKQRLGDTAVALFLILVFMATGCDAPGRGSRGRAPDRRSDVATTPSVTAAPAVYVPETAPTPPDRVLPATVSYEDAEAVFRDGRYDEAADLFGVYASNRPENTWGHYMLGLSAWRAGQLDRAEEAFRRSIELDPAHVKSLINLARVLLELDRPDEARTTVDVALSFDPSSVDAFRVRGRTHVDLGETYLAIDDYYQALLLDERDAWSANNVGLIHIRRGEFREALPPLAHATGVRGDVAVFHNNLGIALERTGYHTAATEAFTRALELDPSYDKARTNLARVEGREDRPTLGDLDLIGLARSFVDEVRGLLEPVPEPVWEPVAPVEPIGVPGDTVPTVDSTTVVADTLMARDTVPDIRPDSIRTSSLDEALRLMQRHVSRHQ
ncbi:MAG TPA: tetratricopeptide repeat protein [Gemmatimonadales bacterium]